MGEVLEHKCGVCVTHTLHDVYSFLKSLQHRGRDTASITAIGKSRIDALQYLGEVETFNLDTIIGNFNEINRSGHSNGDSYHTFFGHLRYATSGIDRSEALRYAHPVVKGGKTIDKGNHIYHIDCDAALIHNGQVDVKRASLLPHSEGTCFDTEALLSHLIVKGYRKTLEEIPGSYFLAFAEKGKDIIVMRDRHGMMPGVFGLKDGEYVFASEDIALRENGAKNIRNAEPGRAYFIGSNGLSLKFEQVAESAPRHCFFQWNYIGSPKSIINDVSVETLRRKMGEKLADIIKPEVDVVTYLPECPEISARSYAERRGLPFKKIFYKRKPERSFLGKDAKDRRISIEQNLHVQPIIDGVPAEEYLLGKSVLANDDSLVRGNNSAYAVGLLKDMGVKEVHLVVYTPKIGIIGDDGHPRGCEFGVDMPTNDTFIARGRTDDEINKIVGAKVHYMPYESMLEVFEEMGMPRHNLCTFCIGGSHPFL